MKQKHTKYTQINTNKSMHSLSDETGWPPRNYPCYTAWHKGTCQWTLHKTWKL